MCGVAGFVQWDGRSMAADDARSVVERVTTALAHRGPDGAGVVQAASVAGGPLAVLGHRRLAIIDLSKRGAQPMVSPRRRVTLSYNGEIYNYRVLRQELEGDGRTFASDSDTEVLLQGYEAWGPAVVERLRGMFAFAIWDGDDEQLFVARDRFGIKPLYVCERPEHILVASEVRALLASGLVPRRLDTSTLDAFLEYQTVPSPRTLVAGVRMLPAGHVGLAKHGRPLETRRYWDLVANRETSAASLPPDEARAELGRRLRESVALHLTSDVPVGAFLSSGIDSSAIVALVREAGVVPRTFTVSFPATSFDEGPNARAVAHALGAEHTEIPIALARVPEQIAAAVAALDHPSGDAVNSFLVSHAVRAAGLTVALSGVGGDELFGGYPYFRHLARLARAAGTWGRSPRAVKRLVGRTVALAGRGSPTARKAAALLETDGSVVDGARILRQMFSPAERRDLLGDTAVSFNADDDFDRLREAEHVDGLDLMSLVSYIDATTYMHDVLLRDTDQMSMHTALEVRVPLLDHVVAEFVMGLSDAQKGDGDVPKRALVESVPPLPPVVLGRKRGFVLPFADWMRGELRDFCEAHLGDHGLAGRGILRAPAIARLWADFLAGDPRTTWSRPWTLVALDAWMADNAIEVRT
ncbi:MAG TPA: asparagine synthase (glutamine-hydrolyzing) [Vicinamibacterales bacterium]|nr:asparagine synthase (glutamine-hydrolyzing) [Vicinamibacterales bacterium]